MGPWNAPRDYGRSRSSDNGRGDSRGGERKQDFPNSGALFPTQRKRSEGSPDFYGSLQIDDDVLDYIIREAEGGAKVVVELSGWSRVTRDNMSITSIKVNIPYAVRQEQEGNQSFRPRYPNRGQQTRSAPPAREQRDEREFYRGTGEPRRAVGERQPQPTYNRGGGYAEQSGGTMRRPPAQEVRQQENTRRTEEFSRGDQMPDFLRDDDKRDPNDPPW